MTVQLTQVDEEANARRDACEAALKNTFATCQVNLAGRTHWTAADTRLFRAMWTLLQQNFAADVHEAKGDHVPQTQVQNEAPAALTAVEKALEEQGR